MNKKIIALVFGCIGCFANIAEAQNVYTMFAEKQYIVYDKLSGSVIAHCAYEPVYAYDRNEYDVIVPVDLNTKYIDEETPFMGVSFSVSDVTIVEADTGKNLQPGAK